MRRTNERNAALGYRARRRRLGFGSDLVDHNDFGHMIFDGFDHHRVLQRRIGDLHAPREADSRMWNIRIAGNFIRRIDDHDALTIFGQDACAFAQHRRFTDTGSTEQTYRFATA